MSDSHAVVFDSGGRLLRFVVCPDCAHRFQVPRPVVLNLEELPPPDRADRELKEVAAHVWFVSNVRSRPPGRVLQLRDADVRRLAADSDRTPTELVEELASRGVLAPA